MRKLLNFLLVAVVGYSLLVMTGCTNPSVKAGDVGYVTNEPFFFGEKGEFLEVIIGPSSYGFGWCDEINYVQTYKPWTVKEHFSPIDGAGDDKETDSRIMSKDKINMELSVSIVLYIRNSPATPEANIEQFKINAKDYFENYMNFWNDRYQEPFRTQIRNMLGKEDYGSAKENRVMLSAEAKAWLEAQFEGTPIGVLSVNISNINPPARMLAEQELLKATEISKTRQSEEKLLQDAKKEVLVQEATNLKAALLISPELLKWKDLAIKEKYVDAFNNLVTGEESKSISKVIFMPYGTPIAASTGEYEVK